MLTRDDERLMEGMLKDWSSLEQAAPEETRHLYKSRRELIEKLKTLFSLNPNSPVAADVVRALIEDYKAMREVAALEKEARLLFGRRLFALEMMLRRIEGEA